MTKETLRTYLESGKTMDELFHYTSGQECLIYKANAFMPGEEIIYIPDITLNEIPMDRPLRGSEEIEDVLRVCYTGVDFLAECNGNLELARQLFSYCDWQNPSSALQELDQAEDNNEEEHKVTITILQAPYASLLEHGFYMKMYSPEGPYEGVVPADYYLPVYRGEIVYAGPLPDDQKERDQLLLEHTFCLFNINRPSDYCGRSLSVGDIILLEGRYYLCVSSGFTQVTFTTGTQHPFAAMPATIELLLPSGIRLQASAHPEPEYPCINIDMIGADGARTRICFVEHNPEKEPGRELCIGAYCTSEPDTVYYGSYNSNISD